MERIEIRTSVVDLEGHVSTTVTALPIHSFTHHHASYSGRGSKSKGDHYDPEVELLKAKEAISKEKSLPFWIMFRYARFIEIIIIIFGGLLAIFSGIFIPMLHIMVGNLIRAAIMDYRCDTNMRFPKRANEISLDMLRISGIFSSTLFLSHYLFSLSADFQIRNLRETYFENLLRKDFAWFDTYVERDFARRLTQDVTLIRSGLGSNIPILIYSLSCVISGSVVSFLISWRLSLLLLFAMVPISLLTSALRSYCDSRELECEDQKSHAADHLAEEILTNIKLIRVFQGEVNQINRYVKKLKSGSEKWIWIILSAISGGFIWFNFHATFALIFWLGGIKMPGVIQDVCKNSTNNEINGSTISSTSSTYSMSFQDQDQDHINSDSIIFKLPFLSAKVTNGPECLFVIFFNLLLVLNKLELIPWLCLILREAQTRAADVFFLIDWKSRIDNLSNEGEIPQKGWHAIGKLELVNVSLKFPLKPSMFILEDIKMTIYPGQIVGIVGPSGSGKTALINLIERTYDSCSGNVYFDGKDISKLNVKWLRDQIGKLSNDGVIFNTTIEDNIRYGKLDANFPDIIKAANKVHSHLEIINLPKGYKTICGYKGENIPEKLRLKILMARIFLRMPTIMILENLYEDEEIPEDDPILSNLSQFRNHSTIILTARKFNKLTKACDYIYVLEDGKIIESGTNEDLLVQDRGTYYKMIEGLVDLVVEKRPIFQSQLQSFKFAKAIERMHMKRDNEDDKISDSSIEYEAGSSYLSLIGGIEQAKPKMKSTWIWYRFVHIIHRIFNEKSDSFDPLHMERQMDKRANRLLHERDIWRIKRNVRYALPKKQSMAMAKNTNLKNLYGWSQTSSDDNISIRSDDSEIFWEDYYQKMDISRQKVERKSSIKAIIKIGFSEWKFLGSGMIFMVILGMCIPLYALQFGKLVEAFVTKSSEHFVKTSKLSWTCIEILIIGLVMSVVSFCQRIIWGFGGHRLIIRLRKSLFESILRQDLEWFDIQENDIGLLCSRLSLDCTCIQRILVLYSGLVSQCFSTLCVIIGISLTISYTQFIWHTLWLLVLALILLIIIWIHAYLTQNLETRIDLYLEESTQFAYEVMTNFKTIIELGLGEHFLQEYKSKLGTHYIKLFLLSLLHSGAFCLVHSSPYFLYAFWSSRATSFYNHKGNDPRDYANFFVIVELLIFVVLDVGKFIAYLPDTRLSREASKRFNEVLNSIPQIEKFNEINNKEDSFTDPPEILLKHIIFDYSLTTDKGFLRNISFNLPSKKFIAIVGHGDSGRSAVVGLILRLYKPSSGHIEIGDISDVNQISLSRYRRMFALINLDPGLVESTIEKNIAFGDCSRKVSHEEIVAAAKQARVHKFIAELPDGYKSRISDLGHNPIGFAIRQRISVARAIIRKPKILIVEDGTSSIDKENESILLGAISNARRNRTLVISTERIAPVRKADLIIVLQKGKVVEFGNDAELMANEGPYFEMFMTQRLVEYSVDTRTTSGSLTQNHHKKASLNYDEYSTNISRRKHKGSRQSGSDQSVNHRDSNLEPFEGVEESIPIVVDDDLLPIPDPENEIKHLTTEKSSKK